MPTRVLRVTAPNGQTWTRTTARPYTHAVVFELPESYRATHGRWTHPSFAGSRALAEKAARSEGRYHVGRAHLILDVVVEREVKASTTPSQSHEIVDAAGVRVGFYRSKGAATRALNRTFEGDSVWEREHMTRQLARHPAPWTIRPAEAAK